MDNQNISAPQLTLEEVSAQLESWRKTKSGIR